MSFDCYEHISTSEGDVSVTGNLADNEDTEEPIAFLIRSQRKIVSKKKIPIYPGKDILIGRDAKQWYDICRVYECYINNSHISKQHFRIYSVIYEQNKKNNLQPLVYCEDLESTNGTYVNNNCIGKIGLERLGYLLSNGDLIEIRPHWQFKFHQPNQASMILDKKKLEDLQICKDQFTVSDRILGRGHYGAVFLAKENTTSRQLACKIVDLNNAAYEITKSILPDTIGRRWINQYHRNGEGRKLVMREINILSKLDHPHIINLKRALSSDTNLYIFTELAPAGDLFSYLESHGGYLTDLHSRVISRQLVLAVEYIHSKGIVHRDIKPENVLIMQTDFGSRIVLTDFGFANYIDIQTGRLSSRLGTEGFIAPEVQFLNPFDKGYTVAADVWSLGVLTVCLLTGSTLLPTDDLSQLSRLQIVNFFISSHEDLVGKRWQSMKSSALQYLRGLLVLNPATRMSASEALQHTWFTLPLTEASMIKIGYQRVIRFWKRRNSEIVLQKICNRNYNNFVKPFEKDDSKFIGKLPNNTLSPYFSLDRNLKEKSGLRP